MRKLLFTLICINLFFCSCKRFEKNAQLFTCEKSEAILIKDSSDVMANSFYDRNDSSLLHYNKQEQVKIEIQKIPGKYIEQKVYGDQGEIFFQKVPDTKIVIDLSGQIFQIFKQDIPNMSANFINKSIFQKAIYHSSKDKETLFEITLGEQDTDDIVFIYLTIDIFGNKHFKIEYPEWDEE